MDNSRHEGEESRITEYNQGISDIGISNIRMKKWYRVLLDDCQDIITEALHQSRWIMVEGYHNMGERILEEHDNFERAKIYGKKIVQDLALSLNMSSRTLQYAIQFAQKYPDLSEVPEGKNITWTKIITKYLPETKETTINDLRENWIQCPNCNHKFKM